MRRLLSDTEVAIALGKSKRTIQRWCQDGKLPGATKAGRSWRIPPRAVREVGLGEALLEDDTEQALREATLVCAELRKEWIDLLADHEEAGVWRKTERDWARIAAELKRLRSALERLPEGPGEVPEVLRS